MRIRLCRRYWKAFEEKEFMNNWVQEVVTSSQLQVKWEFKHKKEIALFVFTTRILVPKTLIMEIIIKSLLTTYLSESDSLDFLEYVLELYFPHFFKNCLSFWSNHQFSRTLEMHSVIQKYIQIQSTFPIHTYPYITKMVTLQDYF